MTYEICPICDKEMTSDHECFSYDSLKYSLELDFLGISNELLAPYDVANNPEPNKPASEPKLYDLTSEIEYASPLRVSEPDTPRYFPEFRLIGSTMRRSMPLFLQL